MSDDSHQDRRHDGPGVRGASRRCSRLFEAGVDVCRLNFSHGDARRARPDAAQDPRGGRRSAASRSRCWATWAGRRSGSGRSTTQDGTGGMPIDVGDELVIQREPIVGAERPRQHDLSAVRRRRAGRRPHPDRGRPAPLRLHRQERQRAALHAAPSAACSRAPRGSTCPTRRSTSRRITDRDWECVDWAIENDLDYLAPLVRPHGRRPEDAPLAPAATRHSDIHLIAKIEKAEALQDIDAIIDGSDGLMVARGDLGVEMDVAQVPIIQKDLIRRCQARGQAGDRGDADAPEHDRAVLADAGRGERRRQRDLRRHRRGDAQRRDVGRQVPAAARCT